MASLRLDRVSCTYATRKGVVKAVDELSLHAADGELVVVLGPSGCGKTTTLRLIAGLERLAEGVICMGERDVSDLPPRKRDLAMVFQSDALYPHMSVFHNLAFGLKMRGTAKSRIQQEVGRVAEQLQLSGLLDRRPSQLSGGQRQRVALGRALVRNPQLFLFDEPFSNLDPTLRTEMRARIKLLQQGAKTTTIFVTHDQEEAMTLADRIAVMRDGTLQQFAAPMEVYNTPANRFVAGFIGSPAMNLLEGEFRLDGNRAVFVCGAIRIGLFTGPDLPTRQLPVRQVAAGIRPPDVELAGSRLDQQVQTDRSVSWHEGTVCAVEPLGDAVVLRIALEGGMELLAKTSPPTPFSVGDRIVAGLRRDKVHFFESGPAGRRIIGVNGDPIVRTF